jgi:hypothetical protein
VSTGAFAGKKEDSTILNATSVLEETMGMPDQRAPSRPRLWHRHHPRRDQGRARVGRKRR